MRNNSNRKSPKPTTYFNETVIEHEFEARNRFSARFLNTWGGASLVAYFGEKERSKMSQIFHFQMVDIDVNIKHILMCVDTGRAIDQRFRRDRGVQIDVELKKVADGISILLHVVTLFTDDGYPRYKMRAQDAAGKFILEEDGSHRLVPATLTFERFFPENKLQKLYDTAEDLLAAMLLRRIRRTLRASGDQKRFVELQRSLDFFLEEAEKAPPAPKLTASAGEIMASKEGRNKKDRGQKPKIGAGKDADSPKENAVEQVPAAATPAADETSFAEVMTPAPVASAAPAPAPKPKKDKIGAASAPRPSLADQVAAVREQVLPGTPDGSNGQQK